MTETKYDNYVKALSFIDGGAGSWRQGAKMDGKFLGFDVTIQYGAFWNAGRFGREPYDPEVHEFDQVNLFMGTDTADPGYLGAEIEMSLGEEREKYLITTSAALLLPKGMPHFPATINRMEKRFIYMSISVAAEAKSIPFHAEKPAAGLASIRAKYRDNIKRLAFERNGPWHYGPNNADTHGGAITDIEGKSFPFHMSYESVRKAPYRFGPFPDRPHIHPYTEFLLFMGADAGDLSELGAECELSMGEERERHIITRPTVAIQPKGFPHIPLTVTRLRKPFIFAVVRPFGHGEGETTRL